VLPTPDEPAPRAVPKAPVAVDEGVKQKVDRMLAELRKAQGDKKYEIAESLGDAGPGTAAYLVSLLETLPQDLRGYVAAGIISIQDKDAIPDIRALLQHKEATLRAQGAMILGAYRIPAESPAFFPLLRDRDPIVRGAALTALRDMGNAAAFPRVASLCTDPDRSIREQALAALKSISDRNGLKEEFGKTLLEALDGARGAEKAELITELARTRSPEAAQAIIPLAGADEPAVRARAISALVSIDTPESKAAVAERMEVETDNTVRLELAPAAAKLRLRKSAGDLIDWLDEANAPLKAACLKALKTLTNQEFGDDVDKWNEWWQANKSKEQGS
jgi:HEAT repeat protein